MPKLPVSRLWRPVVTIAALTAIALGGAAASRASSGAYVVQPGDSLWRIASRSGTTVSALAAANHMRPSDLLLIGRHLTIPGRTSATATAVHAASTGEHTTTAPYGGAGAVIGGIVHTAFCSSFTPDAGPRHMPARLLANPTRLTLRPLFAHWAARYGVKSSLLEAIAWQESGWQEGVVSVDGAVGIGQVMPATAQFVGTLEPAHLSLTAASDNIRLEAAYVAYLTHHVATTCDVIAGYYEGLANLQTSGVLTETVPYVQNVEYLLPGFS